MRERTRCIDTIKGIACIAVVFIHYNWGGEISLSIKTISRFAVPFFFFVSGYYLPDAAGNIAGNSLRRKITHIFQMLIHCAVFYGIFCIYYYSIKDSSWNVWTFTNEKISRWSIANMVISGNPLVYSHFWYLLCLFYCYLVIFAVHKKASDRAYRVAFVLFLTVYTLFAEFQKYFGLKNYVTLAEGCSLVLSNNSLLRSMPFFLWGICLKKFICHHQMPNVGFIPLLAVAVSGCLLAILEDKTFGTILMYGGTHITVLALSGIAVCYPAKSIGILEYIGNKLSMYVYIYHIAVGKTWDLLASQFGLWGNSGFKTLRPILVILCSLLAAQMIVMYKKRMATLSPRQK